MYIGDSGHILNKLIKAFEKLLTNKRSSRMMVAIISKQSVKLWDTTTTEIVRSIEVTFSPDKNQVMSDSVITIYNLANIVENYL